MAPLQVYERATLPPCVNTKDNRKSEVGKKGAQVLSKSCTKQARANQKPSLTHRAAGRVEDGLRLGGVHHHLLQALQALLAQLLPVADEPSQAAVHRVVGHDLDQLREVVTVPLTAQKREPVTAPARPDRPRITRLTRKVFCPTVPLGQASGRAHVLGRLLSLLFLYSQYCGVLSVVSIRRVRPQTLGGYSQLGSASNLPHTHGEGVDVFVQLIQQGDGLDDHVVGPVDVEFDFGSGVAVAEAKLGLGGGQGTQALHQGVEMQTYT